MAGNVAKSVGLSLVEDEGIQICTRNKSREGDLMQHFKSASHNMTTFKAKFEFNLPSTCIAVTVISPFSC